MDLTLLRDRILVEPDQARDDITKAGIVIQARKGIHTSAEQLGLKGTVVKVGCEVDRDQLKVGDRVLFGEFVYPEYFENSKRYLILQDKDICGVME